MSLTQAETVFASVHEDGVNDLFKAFFTARPRYLTYATPSLIPPAAAPYIAVPAIPFPGIPGGIQYRIQFEIPVVDFFPDDTGGTSPLPVGPGQLNIHTVVIITVGCYREFDPNKDRQGTVIPISTKLEVWARGKPDVVYYGPGNGEVGFALDEVEIVDITPNSLESVFECILRMVLQSVLHNVRLPFHTLTAGAFSLALVSGPIIEDDQAKIYGNA